MKSLLIIAHGSKKEASNKEICEMAGKMNKQNTNFDLVSAGFLELTKPNIPTAINYQIAQGADEVVVLPYFLSKGKHVSIDIPEQVAIAQAQNPNIKIDIKPYIGSANVMPDLILQLANL